MNEIISILKEFLGKPYSYNDDSGECEFDCPCCADIKGLRNGDGKHNLSINVKKLRYQCWACGQTHNMMGPLTKLIKKYGDDNSLKKYKSVLNDIQIRKLYSFDFGNVANKEDVENELNEFEIELPQGSMPFDKKKMNRQQYLALKYLYSRGLTDEIIHKFRMRYTTGMSNKKLYTNRVIIPSYDESGRLNFWTGRDYLGQETKYKYINSNVPKKGIIFNEDLINWNANITLVEGPFDHIVVPNSIPLLGKVLNNDYLLYNKLISESKALVRILLDNDAKGDAYRLYRKLDKTALNGRVRIIHQNYGKDSSEIFQNFGKYGICAILKQQYEIEDDDFTNQIYKSTKKFKK